MTHFAFVFALTLLLVPVGSAPAQEAAKSTAVVDRLVSDKDRVLSQRDRQLLRVEWGQPHRGSSRDGSNVLLLRGAVSVRQDDGSYQPVDWPLPVSVLVAKVAGVRPNWVRRHDEADTVKVNIILNRFSPDQLVDNEYPPTGGFVAAVSLPAAAAAGEEHLVALCLGARDGVRFTWTDADGMLAQTGRLMAMPALAPPGNRRDRVQRWRLGLRFGDPKELMRQLAELKLQVAARNGDGRFLLFTDLARSPAQAKQLNVTDLMKHFKEKQPWLLADDEASTENFRIGAGLAQRPVLLLLFLPQDLETALLDAEVRHHDLTEAELIKKGLVTRFEVIRQEKGWDVRVTKSHIDPLLREQK